MVSQESQAAQQEVFDYMVAKRLREGGYGRH